MKAKIKIYIYILELIVCSIALYESIPYLKYYWHTQYFIGQVLLCVLFLFLMIICFMSINDKISND